MITSNPSMAQAFAQLGQLQQPRTQALQVAPQLPVHNFGTVELAPVIVPGGFAPMFSSAHGTPEAGMAELVAGPDQRPIDYTLALIAEDVYQGESAGPDTLNGFQRMGQGEIPADMIPEGGHVDENGIIHGPDGFAAALYVNEFGDVVLAFRGSEPNWGDWSTNGNRTVRGKVTPQDQFAMDLTRNVAAAYPGGVVLTGHSLGGGLATSASLATGVPAVVFNPAGTGDAIVTEATERRNEAPGAPMSANAVVVEAEAGNVRVYQNEGDWVTRSQEDAGIPVSDAIGYRVPIEDQRGIPALDRGSSTSVIKALLWDVGIDLLIPGPHGHHGIDNTGAGVFTSTDTVAHADGTTVVMTTPSGNHGLPPNDMVIETVTFAHTEEGRAAQRNFMMTGRLPEDMTGITQVTVTHTTWGGSIITGSTRYTDGVPTSLEHVVHRDGAVEMRIRHTLDTEGNVAPAATTYTYQVTPQDQAEAMQANMLVYGTPHGPIQPGQTYQVTFGHGELQDASTADPYWPANATEPATGTLEDMPEIDRYAVYTATAPGSNWLSELLRAGQHAGTYGAPLDAEVTDATGQPVQAPEAQD